jgi:hypothetical protein
VIGLSQGSINVLTRLSCNLKAINVDKIARERVLSNFKRLQKSLVEFQAAPMDLNWLRFSHKYCFSFDKHKWREVDLVKHVTLGCDGQSIWLQGELLTSYLVCCQLRHIKHVEFALDIGHNLSIESQRCTLVLSKALHFVFPVALLAQRELS